MLWTTHWTALPPVDWSILFFGVVWSIFWVVVACLALWALAYLMGWSKEPETDPLELNEQRYARGEISREQFEELRRHLAAGPSDSGKGPHPLSRPRPGGSRGYW